MKKYSSVVILLLFFGILTAGCSKNQSSGGIKIYYLNTEETGLVTEEFCPEAEEVSVQIDQVLERLKMPEDTVECTAVIPADVEITGYQLEAGKLKLEFGEEYRLLKTPREVLLRGAVVQTLTQIEGVDLVSFSINGEPLKDRHGDVVGDMRSDDFTKNTGAELHSYRCESMNLYFANTAGDRLLLENDTFRYNSNMSVEKAIIEQLIQGPSAPDMKPIIPEGTKVLSVSVKEGICYVNLTEEFLSDSYEIDPKLTIYGLVNSVTGAGNCSQVQIMVNGKSEIDFRGVLDLAKPLQANMEIVEEKK